MITLSAAKRSDESPNAIRTLERVPAVCYGAGKESFSLSVPLREFVKTWKEAGETTTVTLDLGDQKVTTLIHDIQRDPVTDTPTHIDFLAIDMNKEIEVDVPLEFTGTAQAEKNGIGNLVKVLHEVKVKALPANLPHSLIVDVTSLATLEDQIHIKDIVLPNGVTVIDDAEEVVALVTAFVEEKEEVPVMDLESIEVEKKGKAEEEGATEEASAE